MKKLILCALVGAVALSFAACDSSESEKTEEKAVEEQEAEPIEAEETQEEDVEPQPEEDVDTEKAEAEEAKEETNEQKAAEAVDAPDVSAAVEGSATSETKAVPLGSWVKTSMYATQDSTFHTVYVRVTKVTTQSADAAYVESAIETNDKFADEEDVFDEAALEVPADGELVVIDYEVYVPEDFPVANYGMPEPRLYFSIRNIGGGGVPSTDGSTSYVGLGTTIDLNVRDPEEEYQPGHIYAERCIFAMVNGYTNYVAVFSSYPDGTSGEETDTDNLYTVYHAIS